MRTIYYTASSLDGFIADDAHSLSWLFSTPNHSADPGGRYGDSADYSAESFTAGVGAVVMGSSTYHWLRRELTSDGSEFAWPYEQPSWVVTSQQLSAPQGVSVFSGDVATLHESLVEAAAGKDVWIVGGGDLAGQFADAGCLTHVLITYAPVMLGAGASLLPRRLRLRREGVERDGQLTSMLFTVDGQEPLPHNSK